MSFSTYTQVGINTTTPHASAILEIKSTEKGFLPPRMNNNEMDAIITPANGLIVYCTDCSPKGVYYFDGFNFVNFINSTPSNLLSNEVYSLTGKIWMDRNLGASQVATSSSDASSYGDLYQWGRKLDGHQLRNSSTSNGAVTVNNEGSNFIIVSSSPNDWLITQDNTRWNNGTTAIPIKSSNDPCPTGYRVPTNVELDNERAAFPTNNAAGAFASPLKLPVSGIRFYNNGVVGSAGSQGFYWSNTVAGTNAYRLYFNNSDTGVYSSPRAFGFSVRCIKE